jgi:hypothetical protein
VRLPLRDSFEISNVLAAVAPFFTRYSLEKSTCSLVASWYLATKASVTEHKEHDSSHQTSRQEPFLRLQDKKQMLSEGVNLHPN